MVLGVAHGEPAGGVEQGLVQAVVEALVGVGLADEEEVGAVVEDELADGVAVVEVVAEQDRSVGG